MVSVTNDILSHSLIYMYLESLFPPFFKKKVSYLQQKKVFRAGKIPSLTGAGPRTGD
jgi:hypothetical protein